MMNIEENGEISGGRNSFHRVFEDKETTQVEEMTLIHFVDVIMKGRCICMFLHT